MSLDIPCFATSVFWVVIVLGVAGVARGQMRGEDVQERASDEQAQPAPESEDRTGALHRIRAGFSEMFTGGRLQVHLNSSYQASSRQSEMETSFRAYGEQARFLTREEFHGGGHVDVGGSLRVWRALALGASYTQVRNSGAAAVSGTVPHPLVAERDRTVPEQTLTLPHRQRATHAYFAWRLALHDALGVEFSAGPTYFNLRQGFVANLVASEVSGPPFAEVELALVGGEHTRNGVGYNAGVDVTFAVTPAGRLPLVGIGYFVRLTRGSVSLPVDAETWRRVSVGGIQTGVGIRLRF